MLSERYWDVEELALCAKELAGKGAAREVRLALRANHTLNRPIEAEEAVSAYAGAGLVLIHTVAPEESDMRDLVAASAEGRVCLVQLALPEAAGGSSWWCLDCCPCHGPRALKVREGTVCVAAWDTVIAWWTGHALTSTRHIGNGDPPWEGCQ